MTETKKDIDTELHRTNPDYIVYVPRSLDGSTHDTGNEHFLVFEGPDDELMAVWTQSTMEAMPDQRIVFSKSKDEGTTWAKPEIIAGPIPPARGGMASWGFPVVSKSGRIYVLFSKHIGINDVFEHTTGLMKGIYSDDGGQTWSDEQVIPMRRSKWDNLDLETPANWIVWQKPERLSEGKYFVGFTRWVSVDIRKQPPVNHWTAEESVVEFMRFENIDDNPEPKNIEISNFAFEDNSIRVGFPGYEDVSVIQEPSIVALPDGRLFTAMRSPTGKPYYVVSTDCGCTWSKPEVIKYSDNGDALLHPCSPCLIYSIGNGRYIFLYHNHNGHFEKWGPYDSRHHRRPINIALGGFCEGANQPIWFSKPKFLMDNDGIAIGYKEGRADLAMYASFTIRNGRRVLWYPDRKFFLLGKIITDQFLADLTVLYRARVFGH